jgi:hypothetical protein
MSKIFETANYKLGRTHIEYDFNTFEAFAVNLTADSQGFVLTLSDKGGSGKTLTFTIDTCMQDGVWDLEVEQN